MQLTFQDWERQAFLERLTDKQVRIIRLLDGGITSQSLIAKRIKCSRAYVSKFIKEAAAKDLIKCRVLDDKGQPAISKTTQRTFREYEVSRPLKKASQTELPAAPDEVHTRWFSPHNIELKYTIVQKFGEISKDRRTGYQKSWKPRGPERHIFWMTGRKEMGDITIQVHPNTIVGFYSSHQPVEARDDENAEDIVRLSIHEGILKFIDRQSRFGCRIEISRPKEIGVQVSKTHWAALVSKDSEIARAFAAVSQGKFTVDNSPEGHGDPDHSELETLDGVLATETEIGLRAVMALPKTLEAFERKFTPLIGMEEKVEGIHAAVLGGTRLEHKFDQLVGLLASALRKIEILEDKVNAKS